MNRHRGTATLVANRTSIRQVTDEQNWSAPNPGYGNGSINAELPIHAELTPSQRF